MAALPCPPALWTRFSALLDTAMALPARERPRWLDGLDMADAELRPWLAGVLSNAAGLDADPFLESPVRDAEFCLGTRIGPYRLEERLGAGGMGEVWRASRQDDDGPRRAVALKLPYAELLTGPYRERFRRERDVLAALSHPNIGQLYEAGISADGHPYLALELVAGRPITEACAASGATLEQRVALLRQVLDALSYAHRRLIVHRDIKPSNVLVTVEGTVKLLDFGIAKLLSPDQTTAPELTQAQARLATPAYATPEQLHGGLITVATDVYAAGVLAFEMLTGELPFAAPAKDRDTPSAPSPSRRAAANAKTQAEKRAASRLRGDLDAIIAKALSFDPASRYGSAEAFARDLRCWRDGLPVSARRVGWPVLARKFTHRNRLGVSLAAVLTLALTGGAAGIAWQAARAEREATRATAIKDFLINLFQQGDPRIDNGKPSPNRTAKELLDGAADQADAAFAGDPRTEIELLESLGNLFDALDDKPRSESTYARRLELSRALYGPADPRVMRDTIDLAYSEAMFLDSGKALALLETTRGAVFNQYGQESVERAEWLFARMLALRSTHGGLREALSDGAEAIRIFAAHYPGNQLYPTALQAISGLQYDAEDYAAALVSLERCRAIETERAEFDPLDAIIFEGASGKYLARLNRPRDAEQMLLRAEVEAERQLGRDSTWYRSSLSYRAQTLHMEGRRAEADLLFEQSVASGLDKSAATGQAAFSRRAYGMALVSEGDATRAVPLLERVLAEDRLGAVEEAAYRRTEGALGEAYDMVGRTDEARRLLGAARDEWMAYGLPRANQTLSARERWARFLLDHGDGAAAEAEFRAVLTATETPGPAAALAEAGLARLALAHADTAAADKMSAEALKSLDRIAIQYDQRVRIDIWATRAEALLTAGRREEARDWAGKAAAAAEAADAPVSPRLTRLRALQRRTG